MGEELTEKSGDEDVPTQTEERELISEQPDESSSARTGLAQPLAGDSLFKAEKLSADLVSRREAYVRFLVLPAVLLTVALFGGLRVGAAAGDLIFIVPPLLSLILAVLLMILFFRTGLIRPQTWFGESLDVLTNFANLAVILSLYVASAQIFNSLIPEQGLPNLVVSFCFLWTLGTSYFSVADARRLVKTLAALFVIAFLTKYLILLNLASTAEGNLLSRLWEDPGKEAVTYILDLPRFSAATGYIQFFVLVLFVAALFMLKNKKG